VRLGVRGDRHRSIQSALYPRHRPDLPVRGNCVPARRGEAAIPCGSLGGGHCVAGEPCALPLPFETESVDLKEKVTASGADFNAINTKGYVPALVLDNGEVVTENVAVLDYIATQDPAVSLEGPLGRTRLREGLAYISTELHKSFRPFVKGAGDAEKVKWRSYIAQRLEYLADRIQGDYLFG